METPEAQAAVRALCDSLPPGHLLITSRLADWPTHFTSLDLDVLSPAASVQMLLAHTDGRLTVVPDDAAMAQLIAKDLDGLALALEQAAAWVRQDRRTLADYRAAWQQASEAMFQEYHEKGLGDYH